MSRTNEGGQAVSGLRRSAPLLALLALLLATWFGWNGYVQWRHDNVVDVVSASRDRALAETGRALATQAGQYDNCCRTSRWSQPWPLAMPRRPQRSSASVSRVPRTCRSGARTWPTPYANSATFGYSRLALLEAALQNEKAQVRVVRDDGQPRLGVAARVQLGDVPAVSFVRLPLLRLTGPFNALDVPSDGYLALRQGGFNVVQKGDTSLANSAESMSRPWARKGCAWQRRCRKSTAVRSAWAQSRA